MYTNCMLDENASGNIWYHKILSGWQEWMNFVASIILTGAINIPTVARKTKNFFTGFHLIHRIAFFECATRERTDGIFSKETDGEYERFGWLQAARVIYISKYDNATFGLFVHGNLLRFSFLLPKEIPPTKIFTQEWSNLTTARTVYRLTSWSRTFIEWSTTDVFFSLTLSLSPSLSLYPPRSLSFALSNITKKQEIHIRTAI